MNQDNDKFDDNEMSKFEALKFLFAFSIFPISYPWIIAKGKDKKKKQKSDALSTCGCLLVFVAIILLVAVCAA